MNKDKNLKIIVFIMMILLIIVFIIKTCPVLLQNDTLYDVKLGERYFNFGMFHIDDYSFHTGLIYQTHHYLVCILDYLVYHVFSFGGLYCLEIILLSIIGLLFYLHNKEVMKNKFLVYILLFFQLIALSPFVSLRAQMYSYIIFMLELLFIEKYLNTNRKRYAAYLSLLPLLLINLHSGVIYFYFIILGTYLMGGLKLNIGRIVSDRRIGRHATGLLTIAVIGGLLTLINPYGIDGITYGLKTLNSHYISSYITEFQPFNLFTPMGTLIALYMVTCVTCLIFSRRRIKIPELLMLSGTIFMTLLSTRYFSLLVITSVVILPHIEDAYKRIDNSDWSLSKSLAQGLTLMNGIIIGMYALMFMYLTSTIVLRDKEPLPKNVYPVDAVTYIKQNIEDNAHIFNQYEWGSYLMFNDIKTFIDPRCDLFNEEYNNGTTVMKDYIDIMNNNKSYDNVITKYDIDYFLLQANSPLVKRMLTDEKSKKVYSDDVALFIKVTK